MAGGGPLAFQANGELWGWAYNGDGQLGIGNTFFQETPVPFGEDPLFINFVSDSQTLAVKANGELWASGRNDYGQLGIGTRSPTTVPTLVIGKHSFIQAGTNDGLDSLALKANGEVWTWGYNSFGDLGTNTTYDSQSSPVLVVGNHSFIQVGVAGSYYHFALKANGELWGWGRNVYGNLGDKTLSNRSSPVRVVGNHAFIKFSGGGYGGSCALKANGEVWTWGSGNYGELGNNTDSVTKSSPVLVVGNHSFIDVCFGNRWVIALKANGEAWTWGYASYGNLGDETVAHKSSPVKVVGNHSFIEVRAHGTFAFALKDNGEIWGWGANSVGQLGDGTSNNSRSSPVLVVSDYKWQSFYSMPPTLNERLFLSSGGFVESETWPFGIGPCDLEVNKYHRGFGNYIVKYKNGVTQEECEADSWNQYFTPFQCLGWAKVRIEA